MVLQLIGGRSSSVVVSVVFWLVRPVNAVGEDSLVREFCERDTFRAECRTPDEVIIITHAQYGRMREGRCVANNPLGCSVNVRRLLAAECSARRRCDVPVASLVPEHIQPCHPDYRSYLEAAYTCIKVVSPVGNQCDKKNPAMTSLSIADEPVYLSSLVADQTGCGSYDFPWRITALPAGRRLRVWLLDFSRRNELQQGASALSPADGLRMCQVYAVLREDSATGSGTMTVCSGDGSSVTNDDAPIYSSISSGTMHVRMVSAAAAKKPLRSDSSDLQRMSHFLLKVETFGCADLPTPKNGGMRRLDSDVILMWCNDTNSERDYWRMTCQRNQWTGPIRNCSNTGESSESNSLSGWTAIGKAQGFTVLLVVLIASAIGLAMVTFGSVFLCRLRKHRESSTLEQDAGYGSQGLKREAPGGGGSKDRTTVNALELDSLHSSENDYYKAWHQQQQHQQQVNWRNTAPTTAYPLNFVSDRLPIGGACGNSQFPAGNCVEHVYESPKFIKKDFVVFSFNNT